MNETQEFNRMVNTFIMRGLSATDARIEAERCEAAGARPMPLDGCNCGEVGESRGHYAGCPWAM